MGNLVTLPGFRVCFGRVLAYQFSYLNSFFAQELGLSSRTSLQIRDLNGKFATCIIFILSIAFYLGREFVIKITYIVS